MKAIEICLNGKKLFTAGLACGMLDARLIILNQEDPIWLNVVGRDQATGGHARWAHHSINVDDTITMKLVDVDPSDVDAPSCGKKQ